MTLAVRNAGRYELVTRLASGSSGDVHLAHYSSVYRFAHEDVADAAFAIKVIKPELGRQIGYRSVLSREADVATRFDHRSALRIFEVSASSPEEVFIAMELGFGQPLGAVLQRATLERKPIAHELLAFIAYEAASALHLAHKTPWADGEQSPMLHGSLSPLSIMIGYDGLVNVLGIGVGRSRLCRAPSLATLAYRAPELIDHSGTDRRADIYSLGVILYDALTGQRVFKRRTAEETQAAVLAHAIPRLDEIRGDLGHELIALIKAMMEPLRGHRPRSMSEVQKVMREEMGDVADGAREMLRAYVMELFATEMRAQRRMVEAMLKPVSQSDRARPARSASQQSGPAGSHPQMPPAGPASTPLGSHVAPISAAPLPHAPKPQSGAFVAPLGANANAAAHAQTPVPKLQSDAFAAPPPAQKPQSGAFAAPASAGAHVAPPPAPKPQSGAFAALASAGSHVPSPPSPKPQSGAFAAPPSANAGVHSPATPSQKPQSGAHAAAPKAPSPPDAGLSHDWSVRASTDDLAAPRGRRGGDDHPRKPISAPKSEWSVRSPELAVHSVAESVSPPAVEVAIHIEDPISGPIETFEHVAHVEPAVAQEPVIEPEPAIESELESEPEPELEREAAQLAQLARAPSSSEGIELEEDDSELEVVSGSEMLHHQSFVPPVVLESEDRSIALEVPEDDEEDVAVAPAFDFLEHATEKNRAALASAAGISSAAVIDQIDDVIREFTGELDLRQASVAELTATEQLVTPPRSRSDIDVPIEEAQAETFEVPIEESQPDVSPPPPATPAQALAPAAIASAAPVAPTPVAPAPLAPPPVAPTPVAPTPVTPAPLAPPPVAPTPVAPTPRAPPPVAPTPVAPAPRAPTPVAAAPLAPAPVAPQSAVPPPLPKPPIAPQPEPPAAPPPSMAPPSMPPPLPRLPSMPPASFPPSSPNTAAPAPDIGAIALELFHQLGGSRKD